MQIAPMRSIGTVALVLAMPGLIPASSTAGEWRDQELRLHPEKGYTLQQTLALHQRFDLATWNSGNDIDFSRFAYLNTSPFFPHAWIPRAGQVAKLESTSDPQIGETKAKTAEGEMTLDEWTAGHLDGVIVVHNGKIIYERYPRMRPTDRHIWWSVSKSVAGTIVGLLEEQGQIDVSKPIQTYLPKLANSEWSGTPVIDILDHASGMTGLEADDPDAYTDPQSPYGLFEASLGIQPKPPKTLTPTYDYITTLKRQKPSGKRFEYTSVNTFVTAWLAETVTGRSYPELVGEMIWQRMGAEADALLAMSPEGAPGAHGLLNTTLRDLARYGMLFTKSWTIVAKEKVIPDSLIQKIQQDGRAYLYEAGMLKPKLDDYLGEAAAFQTRQWDFVMKDGDFGKSGFHGQTLYVSPSKNLVVASFATGKGYDTWSFARTIAKSLK